MKWITREKVKVDRVACPWLIKKFIDGDAEFVFLPHDTDWASVHDGTLYDVPGCELGHHGEEVSFDAILRKYGLTDPSLALLAQIVRAADSHPNDPHPEGERLRPPPGNSMVTPSGFPCPTCVPPSTPLRRQQCTVAPLAGT